MYVHGANKCHFGIVKIVMDMFPLCQKHTKAIIINSLCIILLGLGERHVDNRRTFGKRNSYNRIKNVRLENYVNIHVCIIYK